jgi:hypothetical protein
VGFSALEQFRLMQSLCRVTKYLVDSHYGDACQEFYHKIANFMGAGKQYLHGVVQSMAENETRTMQRLYSDIQQLYRHIDASISRIGQVDKSRPVARYVGSRLPESYRATLNSLCNFHEIITHETQRTALDLNLNSNEKNESMATRLQAEKDVSELEAEFVLRKSKDFIVKFLKEHGNQSSIGEEEMECMLVESLESIGSMAALCENAGFSRYVVDLYSEVAEAIRSSVKSQTRVVKNVVCQNSAAVQTFLVQRIV